MSRQRERNLKQWLREISSLWMGIVVSILIIGAYNLGILGLSYGQWLDPTADLVPAQTTIRAQHFIELRNAIDNRRELCELTPVTWTDPSLIKGQTPIRAVHINELRLAVTAIYSKLPARLLSFGAFTDDIDPQTTPVRLVHLTQLRTAFEEATCCGDGVCNGPEGIFSCPGDCSCNYGPWVDGACNAGLCDEFEIQQIKVDINDTPGCDDLVQCVIDYVACCDYEEWQNVGCNEGGCAISDMAQTQTAQAGCPERFQCSLNHPDCCSYAEVNSALGCGLGSCDPHEMLWGKAASAPECPLDPTAVCIVDPSYNCCQYQGFVDEGCGAGGGCSDDEMYRSDTPLVEDPVNCPVDHECVLSADCCGYTGYIPQDCGGICAANEELMISTPAFPGELCPVLEDCVLNELTCCGGYSGFQGGVEECGNGGCNPNQIYQVNEPLDPESGCPVYNQCVTNDELCCGGYTGYISQGCGGGGCQENEEYKVNSPLFPASGCDEFSMCILNEDLCCGYDGYEDHDCGEGGCAANQIYQVDEPTIPVAGCVVREKCTINKEICCGGYSGYQGGVDECGQGGCAPNQIYQVNEPLDSDSGCETYTQCAPGEITCCGGYTGYVDQGCGEGTCAANQIYQVNSPNNTEAGCDIFKKCVTDEMTCCGGYTGYTGGIDECGQGDCSPNEIYKVSTPVDPASGCGDKTQCIFSVVCCVYGPFQDVGCGLGSCALNEMQRVSIAAGCADIYACVDDLTCSECTPEEEAPCEVDGCPGTKICLETRLYASCVQEPAECSPGQEQVCFNTEGQSSFQFCVNCNVWGPCSCTFGDVRSCTTPENCPGIRTCANNIWEDCQKITICTPGTTIACTTGIGAPGVQVCNSCGDAYGSCLCENGTTVPCDGGIRTCISGSWSSCVSD